MAGPANPLLNPNAPLQGSALLQAARGLANAQTQPVISALLQQIGQNNAQTKGAVAQVGGLYNALGQQAQGAAGQTGQVAAGLNSQLQGIGADENSQLQGIGDNATQMLARYTPGDGSQSAPALQALNAEIARQKGLAAQNEGAFRSFGATQGANYQGLADSLGGTFALGGQEGLRSIAQAGQVRNEPLSSKLASAIGQRGALITTDLGKLRQQEINNEIARGGLGLKQEGLNVSAANNQRTNATSAANNQRTNSQSNLNNQRSTSTSAANNQRTNATRQQIAAANNAARAQGRGPVYTSTGQRALAPQQQQVRFAQVDALRQLIQDAQRPLSQKDAATLGMQPGQKLSEAQIRGLLADGRNPAKTRFDPALIDTAYALNGYGGLTPTQITELNKLGLIVGNRYPRVPLPSTIQGAGNLALNSVTGF